MRTRALPPSDYEKLRRELPQRSRLALDIMADTGLRISDVLNIKIRQLSTNIKVKDIKTGFEHTVKLSPRTLAIARRYAAGRSGVESLIPFHRKTIWKDIAKGCDKLQIDHFSPHSVRKLYARKLYKEHGDINVVRDKMGHKSITATMFYLFDVKSEGN